MGPQMIIFLYIASLVSTENISNPKKVATSYSVIYRYDTPVAKTDSSAAFEKYPSGSVLDNTSIFNGISAIAYEISKPVYNTNDKGIKISEGNVKYAAANEQSVYNIIPLEYSEGASLDINNKVQPLLAPVNMALYPSLNPAPIIQEGRLITPGLSTYASNEIADKESHKSATGSEQSESHVSFSGPKNSYSW